MGNELLFVDTGAWFALADSSDQYHIQAIDIYPRLLKSYQRLATTNLVIAETYILIRRNMGHLQAMTYLDSIGTSPRITKIYSNNVLEESAIDILRRHQDQDFSYTDAVSFAIMEQYGIQKAFSFDQHFVTAGFNIIP